MATSVEQQLAAVRALDTPSLGYVALALLRDDRANVARLGAIRERSAAVRREIDALLA